MKNKLLIFFILLITINCNHDHSEKLEDILNPWLILLITLIIVIISILFRYLNTNPLYNQKDTFPLNIKYLFQDKPINSQSQVPKLDTLTHNVSSSLIYGQIYTPPKNNNEKYPVLIFFHGFPGITTFDDVANSLCRAGCIVIIPKHRGAWGSQGFYSMSNCIDDAESLTNYVYSGDFQKKYNADVKNIFLMGHSMGGNTVVNVSKKLNFIKGIILLAPCDMVTLSEKVDDKNLVKFFEENGANVLKIESMEILVKETREKKNFNKFNESVKKDLNVFVAVGEYDNVTPAEICVDPMLEELKAHKKNNILVKKTYNCEHGFMGVRTNLTRDIAEFINKCYSI